jgi:hypothetical protein
MHRDAGFDFVQLSVLGGMHAGGVFAVAVGCATVTLMALAVSLRAERAGRILWTCACAWLRFAPRVGEARNVVGRGISVSLNHGHPLQDGRLVSGVRVWHATRCMGKAGPGERVGLCCLLTRREAGFT